MVEPLVVTERAMPNGEDLIERCRDGDGEAFEALVAHYAPLVGRLVAGLVDDAHAVADLVQETFLRAHRGSASYRGGPPESWLGRIALNVGRDYHRRGWIRRVDLVADAEPVAAATNDEPEPACLCSEQARRIRTAIARLPRPQAEAVRLRFLLGCSYVRMAELLSLPESTLRSRVKAGLARLRQELADYFEEGAR